LGRRLFRPSIALLDIEPGLSAGSSERGHLNGADAGNQAPRGNPEIRTARVGRRVRARRRRSHVSSNGTVRRGYALLRWSTCPCVAIRRHWSKALRTCRPLLCSRRRRWPAVAHVLAPFGLQRLELRQLICREHTVQRLYQLLIMLLHRCFHFLRA